MPRFYPTISKLAGALPEYAFNELMLAESDPLDFLR